MAVRFKIEDPIRHFSSWAYQIEQWHWVALGVTFEWFKKDNKPYSSYVQNDLDFSEYEGTVFYKRNAGSEGDCLQLIAALDSIFVEVHELAAKRTPYVLTMNDLISWLKTGARPQSANIILPMQSKSPLLFMNA